MERAALSASLRDPGKGGARRLRRDGAIPAIVYGKGTTPLTVSVPTREMEHVVHSSAGMNILIDLDIQGREKVVVRVRDYQADPIERAFTHLDFQAVDLTQKIVVEVPVHFEGKSEGVKLGGVLTISRRTIEVRCLPTNIPEFLRVDISALMIGDGIHVNDLQLPEGVEVPPHVNYSVVSVVAPQKEEEAAPAVEASAVPATEAAAPAAPVPAPAAGAPAAKGKGEKA